MVHHCSRRAYVLQLGAQERYPQIRPRCATVEQMRRPTALRERQITGRAFSEDGVLIRTSGSRYDAGRYSETETRTDIKMVTAPPDRQDPRVRILMEGGTQLDAIRRFFTIEDVQPTVTGGGAGDLIEHNGERWRIRGTGRWGHFSDSVAVRQEDQ